MNIRASLILGQIEIIGIIQQIDIRARLISGEMEIIGII
jgi:hypothetical protein